MSPYYIVKVTWDESGMIVVIGNYNDPNEIYTLCKSPCQLIDMFNAEIVVEKKPQEDWFNGKTVDTELGKYVIAKRDGGIEVCKDGKVVYSSPEEIPCLHVWFEHKNCTQCVNCGEIKGEK